MIEPTFGIPAWVEDLIKKYYKSGSKAFKYYYTHCVKVTTLALEILENKPGLDLNRDFVIAGGMFHDIGIIRTHAPEIGCHGEFPYIAHTYLGREILEKEGYPEIAPICERHIGTGLSKEDIIKNNLPLPHRDMIPVSPEEKLICFADKFYSKSEKHLTKPKSIDKIRLKVSKYGEDKLEQFNTLLTLFGKD